MSKLVEITDETAEIVASLSAESGLSEMEVIASAVRARREITALEALRSEIDHRIETAARRPAEEVFARLEEKHRRRMAGE